MVSPTASNDAVAFTPGGGRVGQLAGGAFDGVLGDAAARRLPRGRHLLHTVTEMESPLCGLPVGTPVEFLVVPAEQFPAPTWPALLDHQPVAITAVVTDGEVVDVVASGAGGSEGVAGRLLADGCPGVAVEGADITTAFVPIPRLVVAGGGPYAQALAAQGDLLGWRVSVEARPDIVAGLTATLSWLDAIVVMGHDIESSSRCLMAALASDAGYVGALGSLAMQESRAEWLAYRDITDLSRVHGPAGLDLGARNPAEVAVSIVAQILVERTD